jgi:ankyrin repeat protein
VVTLLLGRGADKEAKTGKVRFATNASLLLHRVCAHAGGAADGVAAAALRGVEEPRFHHRGAARERRRRACERRRAQPITPLSPVARRACSRVGCVVCAQAGQSALHLAAKEGRLECARLLLESGAVIDAEDKVSPSAQRIAAS